MKYLFSQKTFLSYNAFVRDFTEFGAAGKNVTNVHMTTCVADASYVQNDTNVHKTNQ